MPAPKPSDPADLTSLQAPAVRRSAKTKPRILVGGLFHETHTFLDGTTGLGDFQRRSGDQLLAARGDASPLGGVLELAEPFGWEMIATVDYRAQPSATVADEVIEHFWNDFAASAAPALHEGIDGIYLILHGAMASQSFDDVEGEILARLRQLPGAETLPVFGVFDLHANFTARMAALADCLVGYRENPHTDAREAACTAARLLDRCLRSGERPRMRWQHPPLMWPPTGTGTGSDPMKTLEAMARRMEASHAAIWAVSVVGGFSFADTPDTGVSFVACGTDDGGLSFKLLQQLSDQAWQMREAGNATEPPVDEVLEVLSVRGNGPPPGLTVLVEPSDNIGGGAPGDGTGLLRALLGHGIANAAVAIADAQAVAALESAAPGSRVLLQIGGRGSRLDPGPLTLEVERVSLGDGRFELEDKNSHLASMSGSFFDMGRCAVVRGRKPGEANFVTILLTTIKTPPFDLGQWRSQGLEPTDFSVIGVKAAIAHRRAYDTIATRMLWVDTPGPCSSRLNSLPFKKVTRPVFPLDAGVTRARPAPEAPAGPDRGP